MAYRSFCSNKKKLRIRMAVLLRYEPAAYGEYDDIAHFKCWPCRLLNCGGYLKIGQQV